VVELAPAPPRVATEERCPPLTWRRLTRDVHDRLAWALLSCSNGHECYLSPIHHQVAADGAVTPSAVCPVKDCGWHQFIRLVGWTPPAA